jgi:excisionase family DNA binding protein
VPRLSTPVEPRRLLSTEQAAAYLGVTRNTLRKYRKQGRIRSFRVGDKLIKYDPADLNEFLRELGCNR